MSFCTEVVHRQTRARAHHIYTHKYAWDGTETALPLPQPYMAEFSSKYSKLISVFLSDPRFSSRFFRSTSYSLFEFCYSSCASLIIIQYSPSSYICTYTCMYLWRESTLLILQKFHL